MAPKRKQQQESEEEVASPSITSDSELPSTSKGKSKSTTPASKKPKATPKPKAAVIPLDLTLPNNTIFPSDLTVFPKSTEEGVMRISSWNVCGIQAANKKGLKIYLEKEDADIVVLTETKCSVDPEFDFINERYPYRYFGENPQKGQAGTAVLSKIEPLSIVFGLPTSLEAQTESAGRVVTLEFPNTFVVGTYVPNAGQGLKTMDKKVAFNVAFELYLRQLDALKPVIWTGDLNVVTTDKDIRNWKTNYNKTPGCTDLEINGFNSQLNPTPESGHKPLIDVWRNLHPDLEGHYTYFSYRFQCRVKGIGWRLDSFILSERIIEKVKQCEIRLEVYGASDHVPVICDFVGPL